MPLTELSTSGRMQIPGGPRRRRGGSVAASTGCARCRSAAAQRSAGRRQARWSRALAAATEPATAALAASCPAVAAPVGMCRRVLRVPMLESPIRSP